MAGLILLAGCAGPAEPPPVGPDGAVFERVDGVTTTDGYSAGEGLARWRSDAPTARDVRITSSADATEQPALWQPPTGDGPQPLLVVLHSWSSGYRQHIGIPFAQWAGQTGWGMIAPDFRGINDDPEATGSDLAVTDVLDAIDFAGAQAAIDTERVYVIGFSGGGMMSLLMAGTHPDRFAGAAAWVPIDDLVQWYGYNVTSRPEASYAAEIVASCGGDPTGDPEAAAECLERSPVTHLDAARAVGLPVYLGHGISDDTVPPSNSLRVFNQLADPADRLPEDVVAAVGENRLPEDLRGEITTETWFGADDPEVVFARSSGPVTLVLFEGRHAMVFHPGLEWMVRGAAAP